MMLVLLARPLPAAEPPASPGPEIVRGENDAGWEPLFQALAAQGAVRANLTEHRWFSVRREPTVLTAEMRLDPERGLSLHYSERTIIMDERGVLVRDARGRSRPVKRDDRAPATNALLLPVLRFDRPALEKNFTLHGARTGDAWRLDFVPRENAGPEGVGGIVVHGTDTVITHLELRPKAGLRIAITIEDARTGVTFSAEETKRFFR